MDAGKATTNDDHMGGMAQTIVWGLQLKKELGTGHDSAMAIFLKGMNGVSI